VAAAGGTRRWHAARITYSGAVRVARWVIALLVLSTVATYAASSDPLRNPASNLALPLLLRWSGECTGPTLKQVKCQSPCWPRPVIASNDSRGCVALALAAINAGRRDEHLAAMALPDDYLRLTVAEQLFVLVNLERIARGVPPLVGLTAELTAQAQLAAAQSRDPDVEPSYGSLSVATATSGALRVGGAWAGEDVNALEALFGWIYDDGWGGRGHTSNDACTSPTAAGCWGHRDELLGEYSGTGCTTCVVGTGYAQHTPSGFVSSYVVLIVDPAGAPPSLTFSWNRGVLPQLPRDERVPS
jgi:hypothetical protein